MSPHSAIESRVRLDELGPFDCKVDPSDRWNGRLSPHLPTREVRRLSDQTLRMAERYGHDTIDTIHVIDGREDSPGSTHLLEGTFRNRDTRALTIRIDWPKVEKDPGAATRITQATEADRAAARRGPSGSGLERFVVVHARWQFLDDEGIDVAVTVVPPDQDGLFAIGAWEWTWSFEDWQCACGEYPRWHQPECDCGLTRDQATHLLQAAPQVGAILRRLAPTATSAIVDFTGGPHIVAVFDGLTELAIGDGGSFDTETLGEADAALRDVLDSEPITGERGIKIPPDPSP
ncbi:hypothetical protein [Streptomyces sp. SM12]|uniref:hypothetical protein n=1 Tax=Streptomyces sp. SM12 TaxID=1071602 RepID=UPI000CD4B3F9|nr:hypothetical protein [Streptomyces sp. SM12]